MSHITKRTQAIADAADKLSRAFREADWEAIEDHIGGPRADAIRSMVDALAMPTEGMRLVVEQDYECEGHAVATVMPKITKALAADIERGTTRALRDAIRAASS